MHRGYMALWRKFFDHPFWAEPREFSKAEAWIDILREAQYQHEPKEVVLGMKVLIQHYGECLYSTRTWAKRWMWSESRVRRFFKMLEKMKMISQKSEGITTRIKVINYATYDPKRRANDANPTQMRRTSDADAATTKEGKKESKKEGKENTYASFISEFNRIVGSQYRGDRKSKRQFSARLSKYTPEDILTATENAAKDAYLMGANDRNTRFLTPEYITREDKIDRWLNSGPGKGGLRVISGPEYKPISEDMFQ